MFLQALKIDQGVFASSWISRFLLSLDRAEDYAEVAVLVIFDPTRTVSRCQV